MPGTTSRSLSNISVQANPIVVSASTNCCIATTGPPPQSDSDLLQYHRSNQAYCIIVWKLKPICDRKYYNVFEIWWNDKCRLFIKEIYLTSWAVIFFIYKKDDSSKLKIKFIYSEKATKFCEISTNYLFYVLPVRDSNEWDAKESNFSLWFANTSHNS